jgi:PAS domain S-box-containing protein
MRARITKKTSLKTAIMLRTGGLTLALVVGIVVASSAFVIGDQRRDEQKQALDMAAFLADIGSQRQLWNQPAALGSLVEEISRFHFSFEHIMIEQNGGVLFHTFAGGVPDRLIELHGTARSEGRVKTLHTNGHAVHDAAVAVPDSGVVVHVGVLRSALDEQTVAVLRSIGVGSVLALLLGLGLSWMVATLTSRQVTLAETALRESEERYRLLFEQAPDSIMLMELRPGGPPVIIEANEATSRMHGFTRDEIVGKPISELDAPKDQELVAERVERIMAGEVVVFEAEHHRKDGTVFPVEVIARKIEIGGNPVIQAFDRDISDRKRAEEERQSLEEQLVQAQKMEAIGRLAGGIAHDVNNLLGAIMGAASLIKEDVGENHPQRENLDNIVVACKRGREVTRNFLGYARKGKFVKEVLCPDQFIPETVELLSHTISKKIKIETRLGSQLACVLGDRALVTQALMNVCINAADAMDGDGTLTLATNTVELEDERDAELVGLPTGWYLKIEVSDTGEGMDSDTLRRAFEPFYTTKPGSQGTGLGLSMVYGTMKSHDGSVNIESTEGVGTKVALYLPVVESTTKPKVNGGAGTAADSGDGKGVVLFVDDESLLRSVGEQMLAKLGYTPLLASNGRQAIEVFKERRNEISLVILDLVMPEMDGPETFREMQKIEPEVRVLISSGFTSDEIVDDLMAAGAKGFLEKPFEMRTLGTAAAKALDRPGDLKDD